MQSGPCSVAGDVKIFEGLNRNFECGGAEGYVIAGFVCVCCIGFNRYI